LLKLEHRFASHYTWLTNYTWSHCISTYDFGGELAGNNYQNPANRRAEKADCNFDRRHIFNTSLVIESPGFGNGFAKFITKEWQVSPIVSLYTGQPFTVTTGSDVSLTGVGADRPNINNSISSAPVPIAATATIQGGIPYFNAASFVGGCTTAAYVGNPYCVPLGSFGNAARDVLHNPGTIQWDMSLSRKFHFRERYNVEFRSEFFNFMNHANLNGPAAGLTSSTFGQITSFGGPRLIQFGMKFGF
jgi:hypothetical protein